MKLLSSLIAAALAGAPALLAAQSHLILADSTNDRLVSVGLSGGGTAIVRHLTGPAFNSIEDIAVSPTGTLYVLDGAPYAMRILEVDPVAGTHTIVTELPGYGWVPRLWVLADDSFVLLKSGGSAFLGNSKTQVSILRIEPGPLLSTPVETLLDTRISSGLPIDGAVDPSGIVRFLRNGSFGESLLRLDGGTVTEAPPLPGFEADTIEAAITPRHYRARVTIPSGTAAERWLIRTVHATGPTSPYLTRFYITVPGRSESVVVTTNRFTVSEPSPLITEARTAIPVDTATAQSGEWIVDVESYLSSSVVGDSLYLLPDQYLSAQLIACTPTGDLWAIATNPPRAVRIDTTTGLSLAQLPLLPPPASTVSAGDLVRFQDFRIGANGRAFVTLLDEERAMELNLTTGQLTFLNTGGLPAPILGGPPPEPRAYRIALANGAPAAAPGWTLYE